MRPVMVCEKSPQQAASHRSGRLHSHIGGMHGYGHVRLSRDGAASSLAQECLKPCYPHRGTASPCFD